jgi:hypothetical protein
MSTGSSGGSGAAGSSAMDSSALTPAHERLDCDLPFVIEYCSGATCHNDNAVMDVASSLVLWNRAAGQMVSDIEGRLVNVPATYQNVEDPQNCPSEAELLIDPVNVEESLILKKVLATHDCGLEMPRFPFPEWGSVSTPGERREEFIECLTAWVTLLAEDYDQAQ